MVPHIASDEAEEITLLRPGKPGMAWTTEALIQDENQTLCIFNTSFPVSKGNFFVRGNDILGVTGVSYSHTSMNAHIVVSFTRNIIIDTLGDESASYVGSSLINDLKTAGESSSLDVGKLVALCDELNLNLQRKNTYSVLFCIRAIIDHIPPAFNVEDFDEVVQAIKRDGSLSRTDKQYMQNLARDKNISHDALHRQISTDMDLVNFDQSIPNPITVQILLREAIKRLR